MQPLQRLIASDGYEVMLFPLEYLYMSQDEGGGYSHAGTLQMDFLGWNSLGRVYQCAYYAPCSCECVAITDASANNRIYQSLDKVHMPDGTLDYVTFETAHDNNPVTQVGTILTQGQLMGHTGTAGNVTGDHLHFQTAQGTYAGWEQVPPNNNWQLKNEKHIYDACYVNDTVIVEGYNHSWVDYTDPTPPEEEKKEHKFPWFIINRIRKEEY